MKKIEDYICDFDRNIESAHTQISNTVHEISNVDEGVQQQLAAFQSEINALDFQGNNLFEKELSDILEMYKSNCSVWCDAVNALIKGKEFINQFEKSILVVVFGNVNVGKSSVGNLIAGVSDPDSNKDNYEQDTRILKRFLGDVPAFYEYDLAEGDKTCGPTQKKDALFKEGHVETTSNIQYFTRNEGLTWTDSPGICSVNQKNGDLAKKYVEFADLVIFITTSSSPAKNDEVQELKKLFGKKKPVLILVNKSDQYEKDEIDGKIVTYLMPKSSEDRKKQEDYIQNLFRDEAMDVISEIDAISISTYLAMDAMRENNAEKFEQSGFPRLYEKLGKILEKDAIDLKMNAPRQRVNAMIDEIIFGGHLGSQRIDGIHQYQEHLESLQKNVIKAKSDIKKTSSDAIPLILNRSMDKITSLVQGASHSVRKGNGSIELSQSINQIITEETADVLEKELKDILEDYSNSMIHHKSYVQAADIRLNAKTETVERYVYSVKTVSRDPIGLIEHVERFLFKTEFTRDEVRKHKITESFINGDNSADVLRLVQEQTAATIQNYVDTFMNEVQTQYFGQEEVLISKISGLLSNLEKNLEGRKING
jgi:GTP-binding protein EngB required for normal cell division/archaellum component FlaC